MISTMCPTTPPAKDQEICEAVRHAILTRMPKAEQHITISVEQGVAHLWGILGCDEELAELPRIVASVPGVSAVRDHRRDWAWS